MKNFLKIAFLSLVLLANFLTANAQYVERPFDCGSTINAMLNAGEGIKITGNPDNDFFIENTAKDKIVSVNGSSTGYPNLTVKLSTAYSGTSNSSAVYTVNYPVSYSSIPALAVSLINATDTQNYVVTSSTVSGFSIKVRNLASIAALGLIPTYADVTTGVKVNVTVTPL